MVTSRRDWLKTIGAWWSASAIGARALAQSAAPSGGGPAARAALERRIASRIADYAAQGFHRTGTDVDARSAAWLAALVAETGLAPAREAFTLNRVEPAAAAMVAEGRRVEGIPLFDAAFTDERGIRGRLGPLGSAAEIGLTDLVPNQAAAGRLGEGRRSGAHKAIVCVTRGGRPGLSPSNADFFTAPFGPPALQVSSDEGEWLAGLAERSAPVQMTAQVRRVAATADNVTATIAGTDPTLPPLVVMTPRSGWYSCASERGGGIACWLELMRTLQSPRPGRDVLFVASSGHELGHLGINAYIDRRPGIVTKSAGWMHFGASIGAATETGSTIQASDDELEAWLARALTAASLTIVRRNPRGTVPGGEAEAVHRGGGRYVSVIGRNAVFHNPADRGPEVVDPAAIGRFVDAFTAVARDILAGDKPTA